MKTIQVQTAKQLLHDLSSHSTEALDHAGFGYMSELINESIGQELISQKYLYENLFKKVERLEDKEEASIRLSLCKLDAIARYLGYRNFSELETAYMEPIPEVLQSCLGTWLCYVRRSTHKAVVLVSPVLIAQNERKVTFTLKGPNRIYNGTSQYHNGCLFCSFDSEDGKQFQHVYKIGSCKNAQVLQGVFAGVSSAFDPIAGRVVLVRTSKPTEELQNQQYYLQAMPSGNHTMPEGIDQYFQDYCNNNLMINPTVTFTEDDLF